MKKFGVLVACVLIVAALVRASGTGPSTLSVRVLLTQGGVEVTNDVRVYVGAVPEGRTVAPTLGTIAVVRPSEDASPVYAVPAGREIGIFVLSRGAQIFGSTVQVNAGRHLSHDVILDAGYVQVSMDLVQGRPEQFWPVGPNGEIDFNARFENGTTFLMAAGEQSFQVGRGLAAVRQTVNVQAGQTQNLRIRYEVAPLTLDLHSAFSDDDLTPMSIRVEGRSARQLWRLEQGFDVGAWALGSYRAVLERDHWRHVPLRAATSDPFTVQIDQGDNRQSVAVSLVGLKVDLSGWQDMLPEYTRAVVFSATDAGAPFAIDEIEQDVATLIFFPPKTEQSYAIAVVAQDQVIALKEVGPLVADTLHQITLGEGGDQTVCARVAADFDCSLLSP